jgi:hypothetical protein
MVDEQREIAHVQEEVKQGIDEARPARSREDRLVYRALRMARLGLAAKALRTLSSTMRVAAMTAEVRAKLLELHPERDDDLEGICLPLADETITFDPEDEGLRAELRKLLHSASEPGPSGLAEEHLRVVVNDDVLYRAFLQVMNYIAQGKPTHTRALLLSSHLVPLQPTSEPEDRPPQKIRPVACGELLTRLAGQLALYVLDPVIASIFGNLQLGVRAAGVRRQRRQRTFTGCATGTW